MKNNYLFFIILPVQSKVLNSNSFPMVRQLGSCAVYDSSHFIGHHEFKVLKVRSRTYLSSKLVADEDAVFDFENTDDVGFFRLHLRLPHRRLVYILY